MVVKETAMVTGYTSVYLVTEIAVNVAAGFYHDHLFVISDSAQEAVVALG